MQIDILTVFPEMIEAALDHSIVKRARERGLVKIGVVNLRDFTTDRHRTTDDVPYGGGGGMVMKIEPIALALQSVTGMNAAQLADHAARRRSGETSSAPRIAITDPRGQTFTQPMARQWAQEPHLILLCGHYEGVDERVRQHLVTDEISIGDYILTGGELPSLIIVDALTRLQSGALGDEAAPDKDTFAENLLEYPHYTRPPDFQGWPVPKILLSGHHAQLTKWRRWHQLQATRQRRPDLFDSLKLSKADQKLLAAPEPEPPYNPKVAAREAKKTAHMVSYTAETDTKANTQPKTETNTLDNKPERRDEPTENAVPQNERI